MEVFYMHVVGGRCHYYENETVIFKYLSTDVVLDLWKCSVILRKAVRYLQKDAALFSCTKEKVSAYIYCAWCYFS
jgi:hypothetical protein